MASPLPLPDLEPEAPQHSPAPTRTRPVSRGRTTARPPRPEARPETRPAKPPRPARERETSSAAPRERAERKVTVASWPARVAGAAIDGLVLLVGSGLVVAWITARDFRTTQVRLDAATGEPSIIAGATTPPWVLAGIPLVLTAAYMILLIGLWGRTLGGWAVGIRCIPVDTATGAPRRGARPGLIVGARRWLILYGIAGAVSLLPVVGGFAWIIILLVGLSPLWDRSGRLRGWQDRFAGDLVVRA